MLRPFKYLKFTENILLSHCINLVFSQRSDSRSKNKMQRLIVRYCDSFYNLAQRHPCCSILRKKHIAIPLCFFTPSYCGIASSHLLFGFLSVILAIFIWVDSEAELFRTLTHEINSKPLACQYYLVTANH